MYITYNVSISFIKLKKDSYIFFLMAGFSFSCFGDEISSLDVVQKIEQNLIYSKEIMQEDNKPLVIQKGGWTAEESKKMNNTFGEKKINTSIKKSKEDNRAITLKRKAFDAMNIGQYEIAIDFYKKVLSINSKDTYATLGLATAYQYLGQYVQAKPLYLKVLEAFPNDQQVMSNLLAIITDETPFEAVYLLSNIADKNFSSPLMQAQTSLAYSKVKNYEKAIEYIKRAIELDNENLEYRYNLAVLYDLNKNYDRASNLYNEIANFYIANPDIKYNLPIKDIRNRAKTLKNNKKSK